MIKVYGHIGTIIIKITDMAMIYVMVISLAIITIVITIILLYIDWAQWGLRYWTSMHGIIFNPYEPTKIEPFMACAQLVKVNK